MKTLWLNESEGGESCVSWTHWCQLAAFKTWIWNPFFPSYKNHSPFILSITLNRTQPNLASFFFFTTSINSLHNGTIHSPISAVSFCYSIRIDLDLLNCRLCLISKPLIILVSSLLSSVTVALVNHFFFILSHRFTLNSLR